MTCVRGRTHMAQVMYASPSKIAGFGGWHVRRSSPPIHTLATERSRLCTRLTRCLRAHCRSLAHCGGTRCHREATRARPSKPTTSTTIPCPAFNMCCAPALPRSTLVRLPAHPLSQGVAGHEQGYLALLDILVLERVRCLARGLHLQSELAGHELDVTSPTMETVVLLRQREARAR